MTKKLILAAILFSLLFLSGCTLLNALKKPDTTLHDDTQIIPAPAPAPAPAPQPSGQPNSSTNNSTNTQTTQGNNSTANATATINGTINAGANSSVSNNSSANGTSGVINTTTTQPMRPRRLEMAFYDVGFGDATLVRTNNITLLIDTGTNDSVTSLVGKLRDAGVDKIDAVVITDWSADKAGGLSSLMDRFVIGQIWAPEQVPDLREYAALKEKLNVSDVPFLMMNAQDRINYTDLRVEVLNPPVKPYSTSGDINSMVIRMYYGKFCAFLPSDIQNEQESMLVGSMGSGPCDVYKWPYHGRGRPTTSLLFDRLDPFEVIISTGPNTEGLPSPTTLERLRLSGVRTWRTDVSGDIGLYANLNESYVIGPLASLNDTG